MSSPAALEGIRKLLESGQYEQARATVMRLLQRAPRDGPLNNACAIILTRLGQNAQALFFAERAAAAGTDPVFFETYAHTLANNGRPADGAAAYKRAIALNPGHPMFYIGASAMLQDSGDCKGAVDACREALRLSPDIPTSHAILAGTLQHAGEIEEAASICRAMLDRHPQDPHLLQTLLLTLNYSDRTTTAEMLDIHRRMGAALERGVSPLPLAPTVPAESRLRIGYISPDFRQHSVAHFIEPVLDNHDPGRVDVFIYHTNAVADAVTHRLRKLPHTWRDASAGTDLDLARRIAADKLDILIELSGHTTGNRLGILAHRPAPIQMSWIGYPNTTGLSRITHRIVDATTDPLGSERSMTETPLRLPRSFLCYKPHLDAPPPQPRSSRPFTFGSFNAGPKMSDTTITLWSRILAAVPDSRLILKCRQFACPWVRGRLGARFNAASIPAHRLDIVPPIDSKAAHFAAYSQLDIALDPTPYNGTTTTCEALWMGVPVIALTGTTHAARVGTSLLHAAGLDDLVARSDDDYVRIAVELAASPARLDAYRRGLRDQLRTSALCDAAAFTRSLEDAYTQARRDRPASQLYY